MCERSGSIRYERVHYQRVSFSCAANAVSLANAVRLVSAVNLACAVRFASAINIGSAESLVNAVRFANAENLVNAVRFANAKRLSSVSVLNYTSEASVSYIKLYL